MTQRLPYVLMAAALAACTVFSVADAREVVDVVSPPFRSADPPAGPGARAPFLYAAPGGSVTLSWVEPTDAGGHRLRFAAWRDGAWSEAATAAEGTDWFVNWADVPSVIAAGDGRMAAHWLVKSGADTYAYDIRVAQSFDGGATWGAPVTPHTDGTASEHGFVSMLYVGDALHVVWLDGRKYADEDAPDETSLRAVRIDRNGALSGAVELDARTCDCCPTAVTAVEGGFVVAYRDRAADEVRDISAVRFSDGAWGAPQPVAHDAWKINGCPVNGPALGSVGGKVALAWFTMDGDEATVKTAWSSDDGRTFGAGSVLGAGGVAGRVAVAIEGDAAATAWIATGGDQASIDVRCTGVATPMSAVRHAATTSAERAAGYPRIAVSDGSLLLAWTRAGDPSSLRAAVAPFAALVGEPEKTAK